MKTIKKKVPDEVLTLDSYKHVAFSREIYEILKPHFEYETVIWRSTIFGKKKKSVTTCFIKKLPKKPVYFVGAGFLTKIESILKKEKISYRIGLNKHKSYPCSPIPLPGIEFRGNQPEILEKAMKVNRGVIHAYTSFGKTITAAAIINSYLTAYPRKKAVFLAHTKDLIYQSAEEFKKFGLNAGIWSGNDIDESLDVVCVTRQTMQKHAEKYKDHFLVCIRDECHRSGDQYNEILYQLNCPVRYGVTATLPNKVLESLQLEASVGPVIGTVTIAEGAAQGLLAIPEVNFVSYEDWVDPEGKTYHTVYNECITENAGRTIFTGKLAEKLNAMGESCLVFVREVDHGENLRAEITGSKLVNGSSSKETRLSLKKKLESKEILSVVCSSIWNEGISIKSLNNCILAGGGKDEKMVMQVVGRGTRIDEGKTTVRIWDFLDPHKYMSVHTIERMKVYAQNGWKINIIHHTKLDEYLETLKKEKNDNQNSKTSKT